MSEEALSADPAVSAAAADDGVFFVSVKYRGTAYPVPVQEDDAIATIFDFVQEALDFPRENCKLIHGGKTLRPDHDVATVAQIGLKAGSKLMLVASSAQDVSFVQSSRPDPLVKGFVEEERDDIARRKRARAAGASAWGTKQDQEYRFNSIKAEFKFSTPPPFEAEKLLQKLATDPGIIDIMKSRKFKVGILTEMSPQEAQDRMAKKGMANVDLLGYNQNAGEMIVLKLRTDNCKGFRPYHDIMNTLIHEMTHNVWGPHDHNFWKLYGELKAQYMRFHRFWSHSGQSADGGGQFQGFTGGDDEDADGSGSGGGGFGQVLGESGATQLSPRSRRLMAADARAAMGDSAEEPTKPNFLAGNGQWIFVCPCGQTHDPATCEVAQATGSSSTAEIVATEKAASAADGATADAQPVEIVDAVMPQPAPEDEVNGGDKYKDSEAGVPAVPAEKASDAADVTAAGTKQRPTQAVDAEMPPAVAIISAPVVPQLAAATPARWSCLACTLENEVGATRCAVCEAARPPQAPSAGDASLGLDLADLEAHGLDGATVWLSRFSEGLQALRGLSSSRARTAVELILRLVCNVVEHPIDPKFRRVRTENPKIRAALEGAGEEVDKLMGMLGFEVMQEEGSGKVYVLRDRLLDTVRLRLGKELLEQELEASATATAAAA